MTIKTPSICKLVMLLVASLTAGCNPPAVSLKLTAFQPSENTERDWGDVADLIASGLASSGLVPAASFSGVAPFIPSSVFPPVMVRTQGTDCAFLRDVAARLESEILRRGGAVARTPAGATVVNLDVDFLRWSPRDKPPGLDATLAGVAAFPGVLIASSAPMARWTAADAAVSTAVGAGLAIDLLTALTPTSNSEAVWDATVMSQDRVVMHMRRPVYVRDADLPLYARASGLAPAASWGGATTLAVRTVRFDP